MLPRWTPQNAEGFFFLFNLEATKLIEFLLKR